jgi:hypothetical protein
MALKNIAQIISVLLFLVATASCQSHNCECNKPNEFTTISSTKGNKNEARLKCEQANEIAEKAGGSCVFYSNY